MVEELTLRPAQLADFAFCQRTYLEPMRPTIEKLGLDEASHLANFARRWQVEQVRIVMMHAQVIGWYKPKQQTMPFFSPSSSSTRASSGRGSVAGLCEF